MRFTFGPTAVTLFITYAFGVLACRWLVLGAVALDTSVVVAIVAVPAVQSTAVAAWRRIRDRRRSR